MNFSNPVCLHQWFPTREEFSSMIFLISREFSLYVYADSQVENHCQKYIAIWISFSASWWESDKNWNHHIRLLLRKSLIFESYTCCWRFLSVYILHSESSMTNLFFWSLAHWAKDKSLQVHGYFYRENSIEWIKGFFTHSCSKLWRSSLHHFGLFHNPNL